MKKNVDVKIQIEFVASMTECKAMRNMSPLAVFTVKWVTLFNYADLMGKMNCCHGAVAVFFYSHSAAFYDRQNV